MLRGLRKGGVKMEPNAEKKIDAVQHQLDKFYDVVSVKMTEKVDGKIKEVDKDVAFVRDATDFFNYIVEQRGLVYHDTLCRLGIDGGGGSEKIVGSIFSVKEVEEEELDEEDEKPGEMNTGVNKLLIFAICRNIQENHNNLRIMFDLLNLNQLKYCIAADLKLINTILGLSGHGGKFACYACEGEAELFSGDLRDFGSLKRWYQRYVEARRPHRDMQNYKNVVNR